MVEEEKFKQQDDNEATEETTETTNELEEDKTEINETIDEQNEQAIDSESACEKEILQLKEENDQLQNRLLRLQAEFENYKRRTNIERITERQYKSLDVITELLPVLDNFDRALLVDIEDVNKGFYDGMKMVHNQLLDVLKAEGVEKIVTENVPFDPNLHHAVMQVEDDQLESNIVVEELQTGYILKEKVIRPAMVKVNK